MVDNDIINAVCRSYGIEKDHLFTAKRALVNEAMKIAIYLLRYLRGDFLTPIGKVFEIHSYSTASSIIERFKARLQTERNLSRNVELARKVSMRQRQS